MKLFTFFDVDVVEEDQFSHRRSIHLGIGLNRLHPQPELRHFLRLDFVLIEVEIE